MCFVFRVVAAVPRPFKTASTATLAQSVQLSLEYAPVPPFDAGTPDRAPADVLDRVRTSYAKAAGERRVALGQAVAVYRRSAIPDC